LPSAHRFLSNAHFHVRPDERNTQSASVLLSALRQAVGRAAPGLPILGVMTMRDHLDASLEAWTLRTGAWIFGIFAAIAMVLAVAGVYSVRAYSVARRTREIGIRMAIGASTRDTLSMVLREGARLIVWGAIPGVLIALALGWLLQSFLIEVSAYDPTVYLATVAILVTATAAACYLPARRAAALDPMAALRDE
jgi:ABC-type antimicrobial peptide transport system permease subunit